jgi:hypothetical protein
MLSDRIEMRIIDFSLLSLLVFALYVLNDDNNHIFRARSSFTMKIHATDVYNFSLLYFIPSPDNGRFIFIG